MLFLEFTFAYLCLQASAFNPAGISSIKRAASG
jgi:hypothetical protein